MFWSYLLAAVGILGIWLAGRKNLWGWAIGVASQFLWIAYAVVTQQWGFILSAVAYGAVYGWNWYKWAQERNVSRETFGNFTVEVGDAHPTQLARTWFQRRAEHKRRIGQ